MSVTVAVAVAVDDHVNVKVNDHVTPVLAQQF